MWNGRTLSLGCTVVPISVIGINEDQDGDENEEVNIHIKRGQIISDKPKARHKYIAVNFYLINSRCQLWNIKEVLLKKYRCS
jgi:hypothetical protein